MVSLAGPMNVRHLSAWRVMAPQLMGRSVSHHNAAAIGAGVGVLVVLRLTPWGAAIGSWSPSTLGLIASAVLFGALFVARAVRSPEETR